MIYIIGYLFLYCVSLYWMQRDWRKDFDMPLGMFLLAMVLSLAGQGILMMLCDFVAFLCNSIPEANKIFLKRYKS